jgi:mannan endo-1,4-beta-mannosidase
MGSGVLFGCQDADLYGIDADTSKWYFDDGGAGAGGNPHSDYSDAKAVTGYHPFVFGFDLLRLENASPNFNFSTTYIGNYGSAEGAVQQIKKACSEGALITLSWHMAYPGNGKYDRPGGVPATSEILNVLPASSGVVSQDGQYLPQLKAAFDRFAEFDARLTDGDGNPIPVLFRPWHEMSGNWFWWGDKLNPGNGSFNGDAYKALYRFTVQYLRDQKGLHNIIWVYSPDRADPGTYGTLSAWENQYLNWYPGDSYVDVLGMDDYWSGSITSQGSAPNAAAKLGSALSFLAQTAGSISGGRIAALTETGDGNQYLVDPAVWYTQVLLPGITHDQSSRKIAYTFVWRNDNDTGSPPHYFVPYPGSSGAGDFVSFAADPFVWFLGEAGAPDLYAPQ